MGHARSSGQATNLTDPVLALAVYWLRADVMHTLVHDTEDAWLEDAASTKPSSRPTSPSGYRHSSWWSKGSTS